MRKRIPGLLLALVLALTLCLPALAEGALPHAIRVNRAANTVTVYAADETGAYTVPVRAMVCSTARAGAWTPVGEFAVTSYKKEWCPMVDGTWGQYATQFYGNILFHSVCYTARQPDALIAEEYDLLGSPASLGCVRLQVADAKWIYDNCAPGTRVTVYDDADDPGPLGKPAKAIASIPAELADGWEPTDEREENPWRARYTTALFVTPAVTLAAGEALTLTPERAPADALLPGIVWSSDDPAVAAVDENSRVTALAEGTATITAACGELQASCAVTVTGALLPFGDLTPGAWYYADVRWAYENSVLNGTGTGEFSPALAVSRATAIQALYNLDPPTSPPKTAGAEWYAAALAWAFGNGVAEGMDAAFVTQSITRQEFAVLLHRYETLVRKQNASGHASLNETFPDAGEANAFAGEALSWAVDRDILRGTESGALAPAASLTRAELAALLHRYNTI